jgi:hypothetical protein
MQLQRGILIVAADPQARARLRGAVVHAGYVVTGEVSNATAALALAEIEDPSAAVIDTSCCPQAEAEDIAGALAGTGSIRIIMTPSNLGAAAVEKAVRSTIGAPWGRMEAAFA